MPSLTTRDLFVLQKIHDPEAGLSAPLLIDDSLPKDPHVTDPATYQAVSNRERGIVSSIQKIELRIAGQKTPSTPSLLAEYLECIQNLDALIDEYPKYASARNNRAQALRRVYGDGILVVAEAPSLGEAVPLDLSPPDQTVLAAGNTILSDLSISTSLLTPPTSFAAISPQAAKTLSQAYTQRGALYHFTAKKLSVRGAQLKLSATRAEAKWKKIDFEEHASRDFMIGGRYGNEIAKALAVSVNPTAKLCGDMVREVMKKEYASAT